MPKKQTQLPVPVSMIEWRIYTIREHRVMLEADLAELYQVETFNLNKAVRRNIDRFPECATAETDAGTRPPARLFLPNASKM